MSADPPYWGHVRRSRRPARTPVECRSDAVGSAMFVHRHGSVDASGRAREGFPVEQCDKDELVSSVCSGYLATMNRLLGIYLNDELALGVRPTPDRALRPNTTAAPARHGRSRSRGTRSQQVRPGAVCRQVAPSRKGTVPDDPAPLLLLKPRRRCERINVNAGWVSGVQTIERLSLRPHQRRLSRHSVPTDSLLSRRARHRSSVSASYAAAVPATAGDRPR